jgi:hypothetical protein
MGNYQGMGMGSGSSMPQNMNEHMNAMMSSHFCMGERHSSCCTDGGSSGQGDCGTLAFHEGKRQCALSLCENLPEGWSRDAPEGDVYANMMMMMCPIDYEWVEEIDCDDPCQYIGTCGDCIKADCLWSFSSKVCSPSCDEYPCLSFPITDDGEIDATPAQLCGEVEQVLNFMPTASTNGNGVVVVTSSPTESSSGWTAAGIVVLVVVSLIAMVALVAGVVAFVYVSRRRRDAQVIAYATAEKTAACEMVPPGNIIPRAYEVDEGIKCCSDEV